MENIQSEFDKYFRIVPVHTKQQITICQQLRYQVFCRENKIIDNQESHGGLEFDEYDYRSKHCLLMYRPSNTAFATVRLILADPQQSNLPYPIEQFDILRRTRRDKMWKAPRKKLGEISRFAVSKQFKRRGNESIYSHGISDSFSDFDWHTIKRWYPHITLGLFRAIIYMSRLYGVEYWYANMEPSLIRLLARTGINFTPVGPLVEYHGLRQPCIGVVEKILDDIHNSRYEVWQFITSEIKEASETTVVS